MQGVFDFFTVDPMEVPLKAKEFVCFDFETTGLYPEHDTIVEIGAVKFSLTQEISRFECLVNPGRPIPQKASSISGITDAMVADADPISKVLPQFRAFLGDSTLIAHNIAFDSGFLRSEMEKQVLKWNESWFEIDTCEWARRALPGMRNYKLQTLISVLDLHVGTAHRALDDALACRGLFFTCMEKSGMDGETQVQDLIRQGGRKERNFRR